MINSLVPIVATCLGLHAVMKFGFFLLPYRRRRDALDRSYGARRSATKTSDSVLLAVVVLAFGLLLFEGMAGGSFLIGMWIGATLIQVYFHRFDVPLDEASQPPPEQSPIKAVSYAIQADPWRAWREMLLYSAITVIALITLL